MNVCNDIRKIPLPPYLKEHKEEILHIFDDVNVSRWDYTPQKWQRCFADDPIATVAIHDLKKIRERCPREISHSDVQNFAHEAYSRNYPKIRRFFLACMIWGYGLDDNGPLNTKQSLLDSNLERVLNSTVRLLRKGQIKKAYDAFKLKGCGPAFFTKLFYFVGLEWRVKPLPLILDSHVASFLDRLRVKERFDYLSLFSRTSPSGHVCRYGKGYLEYIHSMNDWAVELVCSPDNIERFMYRKDKECEQKEREEGIPEDGIMWKRDGVHCSYCDELLASPPFDNINIKQITRWHVCRSPDRRILFF